MGLFGRRTPEDNERYDEISRKVIRNRRVDPRDFRSTSDYERWQERVRSGARETGGHPVEDENGFTAMPYASRRGDWERVARLQGDDISRLAREMDD